MENNTAELNYHAAIEEISLCFENGAGMASVRLCSAARM